MPILRRIVDAALEGPIVTSFTRIGHDVRSRVDHWRPLTDYDMRGRTVLVTGATSGLGRASAEMFARLGATVVILGRDAARTERTRRELEASTGCMLDHVVADMGDLDMVRAAAAEIQHRHPVLHVLVHNAGALAAERRVASCGIEATIASQVVGPFLLTTLLLDQLTAAAPGRVITVSSGGMYGAGLTVSQLEMSPEKYNGTQQYARAKRAQVTLNEMWAERFADSGIRFHAMHPGWADTPGVDASLPTFAKVMGPLLRTPEQGADTLVWLAADDGAPLQSNGTFWLDRRPRSIHKLPSTRRTDTPTRRTQLWDWVQRACE